MKKIDRRFNAAAENDDYYDSEDSDEIEKPELLGIEEMMDEVDKRDKYELFKEWCINEGVIMPKIGYPATF